MKYPLTLNLTDARIGRDLVTVRPGGLKTLPGNYKDMVVIAVPVDPMHKRRGRKKSNYVTPLKSVGYICPRNKDVVTNAVPMVFWSDLSVTPVNSKHMICMFEDYKNLALKTKNATILESIDTGTEITLPLVPPRLYDFWVKKEKDEEERKRKRHERMTNGDDILTEQDMITFDIMSLPEDLFDLTKYMALARPLSENFVQNIDIRKPVKNKPKKVCSNDASTSIPPTDNEIQYNYKDTPRKRTASETPEVLRLEDGNAGLRKTTHKRKKQRIAEYHTNNIPLNYHSVMMLLHKLEINQEFMSKLPNPIANLQPYNPEDPEQKKIILNYLAIKLHYTNINIDDYNMDETTFFDHIDYNNYNNNTFDANPT